MKRVAIIPPNKLPVPDLLGGAIEGLTTYLIEENARTPQCEFEVFNQEKCADKLRNILIKHCYIHSDANGVFDKVFDCLYLAIRKVFGYRIPYQSSYLRRTIKQIKKRKCDLVLIEGNPHYVWRVAKDTGLDVILHIHTDHVLDEATHSYQKTIRNCKNIICVSEYIKQRLWTMESMDGSKLQVCLNCTDQRKFNSVNRMMYRDTMRKKFGFADDDVVYVYAGRVVEMKGVGELVEAFKACNVDKKKLLIVGGSSFAGSPETEFMQHLREEVEVSHGLIQMTGYVDKDKLPKYYALADAYVSPSKYDEAAPLANIEAMSMGLPCIVSNKGGTIEYVNDGCIVIDVDSNAVTNIRKAMENVGNNTAIRTNMANGRIGAVEKWCTERYFTDMLSLILQNR